MNMTSHEPRKLSAWLRATICERTYFPMIKVVNLAKLVYSMYFLGLIERETLVKCSSLVWAPGEAKHRNIDMTKPPWQGLFRLLKPIYQVLFRIFAHDKRLKKQEVNDVESLLKYLSLFSSPCTIYNASLSELQRFDDATCFYDDKTQKFYYLMYPDLEEMCSRERKPTMVKVIDMADWDAELVYGKGEVLLYGVDRFFFDEEKRRLLFNMPQLQSVCIVDLEKNSGTHFLPKRRLLLGEDVSLFDYKEEVVCENERRGGKIGGFRVDCQGGLLEAQTKFLCDGTYDAVSYRVVDTDNMMPGIVYYEAREEQFVVLLPPDAKAGIINKLKQTFGLLREKAVFRFHDEKAEVVGEVQSLPEVVGV